MNNYRLTSKGEAVALIAAHFETVVDAPLLLSIREDKCFKDLKWLDLGQILLKPGEPELGEENLDRLNNAIRLGFFEWHCAESQGVCDQLSNLMDLKSEDHKKNAARALDSVATAAARVGLIHPMFDADALAQMPFRRPTTVVADTSGVLQGGLDFVVRFLYPMARVKVPAICHMEILNSGDNYFKYRRAQKLNNKARALFEHAISQGGQRALLRLELQTEAEIERGRLGADPLRGIIQSESDQEDSNLGLQKVQRSFADRLIFETARQHLTQTNPDHPVMLLTADQGLARMTLGEGMQPLFFEATNYAALSGRCVSGTTFDPFTGRIYSVGLVDLVWELAVTFGMSKLVSKDGNKSVEICAMGESCSWQPYHAKDDLLWVILISDRLKTGNTNVTDLPSKELSPAATTVLAPQLVDATAPVFSQAEKAKNFKGSYKFAVTKMLPLIEQIVARTSLTVLEAMEVVSVNSPSALEDYKNFLISGGLIEKSDGLVSTPAMEELLRALKEKDLRLSASIFARVPSFAGFIEFLRGAYPENPVAHRAQSTYVALGEVLGLCFEIPGEKIFATPWHPTAEQFTDAALKAYDDLCGSPGDHILTGLWLEELVRSVQIHPVESRALLEEARKKELLERFTEGSTPETGYQNHTLNLLELLQGHPTVRRIGIFEGDFLLPGQSSVSIRLKRVQK